MSDSGSSTPTVSYKWREIADLPLELDALRDRELESLFQVWTAQKDAIKDQDRIREFNAELAREWAIETGVIEGVYTLERGITQTLIERGIDATYIPRETTNLDPDVVARIIRAHAAVLEGLFAFVKGERSLTTGYIKELHAALLRYQDTFVVFDEAGQEFRKALEKGAYKTLPNNPSRPDGRIHEYCPPEHVASEMDRLVELHDQHAIREVPPHIEGAWLHHAFSQIHPFQDGNGRVARTLASIVFIKSGFFPLLVKRDDNAQYIEALEQADQGGISPVVQMFARLQKRSLTRAIGRAADVKPVSSVEEAVAVTRDLLVDVGRIVPRQYNNAKGTAAGLLQLTNNTLTGVANSLANDVSQVNKDYIFGVGSFGGPPTKEINAIAAKLQYDPNTNDHHQSLVFSLSVKGAESRIVVSFHGVGAAFRGLLVAVAYFQSGDGAAVPLSEDIFRISYEEPRPEIDNRYKAWLDQCIIKGLAEWRSSIV